MSTLPAVRDALDLVHMPARVHAFRAGPLPDGVDMLLAIAAGERDTLVEVARRTERPPELIERAAAFYIEQILLAPDADSYRVLGARRDQETPQIRRHMALIMRWLHPDHDPQGEHSMFAARVTAAWDDLKSADRRAAYDRTLDDWLGAGAGQQVPPHPGPARHRRHAGRPAGAQRAKPNSRATSKGSRRVVYYVDRPGPLRHLLLTLLGARRG